MGWTRKKFVCCCIFKDSLTLTLRRLPETSIKSTETTLARFVQLSDGSQHLQAAMKVWLTNQGLDVQEKLIVTRSSTPLKTVRHRIFDFRQEKRMLCVFWDRQHVIHWELLEKGQIVNKELYCEQLSRLRRKMRNRQGPIILLHDTAQLTTNKLTELGWEHLDHPPYSPDLAPSDFHLFRALEHFLRGKRFKNIGEMRVSLGQFFNSKPQDFYRRGIYLLPEKWQQVIDVDGEYFD